MREHFTHWQSVYNFRFFHFQGLCHGANSCRYVCCGRIQMIKPLCINIPIVDITHNTTTGATGAEVLADCLADESKIGQLMYLPSKAPQVVRRYGHDNRRH